MRLLSALVMGVWLCGAHAESSELDTALYESILFADAEAARQALADGADPNHVYNGRALLGWAAQSGVVAMASLLIDAGAELDAVDGVGHTALMRAVAVQDDPMAMMLIEAGADPAVSTVDGATALMWAVEQGDLALTRALVENGADLNAADVNGDTATWKLIQNRPDGWPAMVEYLGSAGADFDAINAYYTALYWAVEQDDEELVAALLAAGANPDTVSNGHLPLVSAGSNAAILRRLLDAGADPNGTNQYGETAVYSVIEYGSTDDLQRLVDAGADLEHKTDSGQTPLGRADALNRLEMTEWIEQKLGLGQPEATADTAAPSMGGSPDGELAGMPKLDHKMSFSGLGAGVTYQSGASVADLNRFYAEVLGAAGWERADYNSDDQNYTSASYRRGKETLTFSLGLDSSADPPTVMVTLTPVGEMSAAEVPRYPGTEPVYESAATAIYVTGDDLTRVGDETFKLLQAAGWQGSQTVRNDTMQMMELTQGGSKLSVYVSIAPAQGNKTSIQYSVTKQ